MLIDYSEGQVKDCCQHHNSFYLHIHSFPTRRSSDLEAKSFAMPASRSQRSPRSFMAAARRVKRRAASILVAMLASFSWIDRKSTRLNSSHRTISYAVFCLNKKMVKMHEVITFLVSIK